MEQQPFPYVKRHFGYAKARCRGLAKNAQRFAAPLGFSNLLIAGRQAPHDAAAAARPRSAKDRDGAAS